MDAHRAEQVGQRQARRRVSRCADGTVLRGDALVAADPGPPPRAAAAAAAHRHPRVRRPRDHPRLVPPLGQPQAAVRLRPRHRHVLRLRLRALPQARAARQADERRLLLRRLPRQGRAPPLLHDGAHRPGRRDRPLQHPVDREEPRRRRHRAGRPLPLPRRAAGAAANRRQVPRRRTRADRRRLHQLGRHAARRRQDCEEPLCAWRQAARVRLRVALRGHV
mmetsp:Transcript_50522/g.121470  ORF Transcript_50522/g.121470 Transcript_50522/m.121470 type:complete len:221 (+) Transcript_50522:473-1135(+)